LPSASPTKTVASPSLATVKKWITAPWSVKRHNQTDGWAVRPPGPSSSSRHFAFASTSAHLRFARLMCGTGLYGSLKNFIRPAPRAGECPLTSHVCRLPGAVLEPSPRAVPKPPLRRSFPGGTEMAAGPRRRGGPSSRGSPDSAVVPLCFLSRPSLVRRRFAVVFPGR